MTRTLQLPDVRRILDGLERRLAILERRIRSEPSAAVENEIIFSHSGEVVISVSPPAYLRASLTLVEVIAALGNPGSSTTTVEVMKDASTVVTLTLGSGDTYSRAAAAVAYVKDNDPLTVAVTGVGTDAADLTVQCRFA